MIAICFVPNPLGLPEVNHIDCNRANNNVLNLEWCTKQYNTNYREKYGISAKEANKGKMKPVIAVNLETGKVFWFESRQEASRYFGISHGNIGDALSGHYKKTHGLWFTYADENAFEKVIVKFGDDVVKKVRKLMKDKL